MKVVITSKNPVKINAVKNAFERVFPKIQFQFESVSVSSGVPDQPKGDEECIRGALNRVEAAEKQIKADYWVGLEGGVDDSSDIS